MGFHLYDDTRVSNVSFIDQVVFEIQYLLLGRSIEVIEKGLNGVNKKVN